MKKFLFISLPLLTVLFSTGCNNSCCYDNDYVVKQSFVHRYGVEVPCDEWAAQGEHGQVMSTLVTGVTVTNSFNGGILDGETTYTFPHSSSIEKVEMYDNGNLVKELTNFPTGAPAKEIQYLSPREERVTSWYENNTPRAIENYKDGMLVQADYYNFSHQLEAKVDDGQGMRTTRDAYGNLVSNDTIQDGILVSSQTYYPNGTPQAIIPFQNDLVEGEKKTFLPGGEPKTVEEWKAGAQNGMTVVYQNGEKLAEIPFLCGVKEGVEKRYRDGRDLVEEISWHNNVQHGPANTYVDGNVITNYYFQGKPVSKVAYDKMAHINY